MSVAMIDEAPRAGKGGGTGPGRAGVNWTCEHAAVRMEACPRDRSDSGLILAA